MSVVLPKKVDTTVRANNWTLSLISFANKLISYIINKQIERMVEYQLPPMQVEFRRGRSNRDQIATVIWLILDAGSKVFFTFIDSSKAFDCVDQSELFKAVLNMDIPTSASHYSTAKFIHHPRGRFSHRTWRCGVDPTREGRQTRIRVIDKAFLSTVLTKDVMQKCSNILKGWVKWEKV